MSDFEVLPTLGKGTTDIALYNLIRVLWKTWKKMNRLDWHLKFIAEIYLYRGSDMEDYKGSS